MRRRWEERTGLRIETIGKRFSQEGAEAVSLRRGRKMIRRRWREMMRRRGWLGGMEWLGVERLSQWLMVEGRLLGQD